MSVRRTNSNQLLGRIALAVPEGRLEHGLSQRQLSCLSGVSRWAISRVERGEPVDAGVLVELAATLMVLDAYQPPSFEEDLGALLRIERAEVVA